MRFQKYDLGHIEAGRTVMVALQGNEANVKLLDPTNFNSYQAGRRHWFYGGHYKRSPVSIRVPRAGTWYLTVDLGGHSGSVRSSVRVV